MRRALVAIAWIAVGIVIGAVAAGLLARRWSESWYRNSSYFDEVARAAASAEALVALDAAREEEARRTLEREMTSALRLAADLESQGAVAMLLPVAAGSVLSGLHAAEAYARAHQMDAEAGQAQAVRADLCSRVSPNSKFRDLCD